MNAAINDYFENINTQFTAGNVVLNAGECLALGAYNDACEYNASVKNVDNVFVCNDNYIPTINIDVENFIECIKNSGTNKIAVTGTGDGLVQFLFYAAKSGCICKSCVVCKLMFGKMCDFPGVLIELS